MDYMITSPTGEKFKVTAPEGATHEDVLNYVQNHPTSRPDKTINDTTADIGKGIMTGARQGAEGLAGIPGDLNKAIGEGANWLTNSTIPQSYSGLVPPTSQEINAATSKVVGPNYQPETPAGQVGQAAGSGMVGSMIGPGGTLAKLATGALSGVGSELAGQNTAGSPYELPARLAGGLVGGAGAIGLGKATEAVRNAISAKGAGGRIGDILGTDAVKSGAVNRVARSLEQDQVTLPGAIQKQSELGPEAMVMDLGRQAQGRAEQMALHSGKAQNTVLDAVEGRTGQFGSEAARRIRETLDQEMGPAHDMVALKNYIHGEVEKHATPAYERLMSTYQDVKVPPEIMSRPAVASAMKHAEEIAANYGDKVSPYAPGLRYWDYVKKGLDKRINGMMRSGMDDLSSSDKADLGGLINAKQSLVNHLDTVTKGEYAAARRIAATKPELDEATDFGRSVINSKLLPEEIKAHYDDLSVPAQAVVKVAVRRQLEQELGRVRNSGAKGRNLLNTDNNLQKIEDIFGPDTARAIEHRISAEDTFQNSTEQVARNSRTAVRQELAKDTANPNFGDYHTTLTGIATAPVKSGIAYALEHGMGKTRSGISDILTANEGNLPVVVEQLLNYNKSRAAHAVTPIGQQSQAVIRALLTEQLGRQ